MLLDWKVHIITLFALWIFGSFHNFFFYNTLLRLELHQILFCGFKSNVIYVFQIHNGMVESLKHLNMENNIMNL